MKEIDIYHQFIHQRFVRGWQPYENLPVYPLPPLIQTVIDTPQLWDIVDRFRLIPAIVIKSTFYKHLGKPDVDGKLFSVFFADLKNRLADSNIYPRADLPKIRHPILDQRYVKNMFYSLAENLASPRDNTNKIAFYVRESMDISQLIEIKNNFVDDVVRRNRFL